MMDAPESNGIAEWVRYFLSGIVGGALMLVGIMRAWSGISRKAEEAAAVSESNTDRLNHADGRINALERNEAAAEAKYTALLKGHERIEGKLDRLTERLGG